MDKKLPANAGDRGLTPGLGIFHRLYGATKPMCHNYWRLEPAHFSYWGLCASSPCFGTREATAVRSLCTKTKSSPHLLPLEKDCEHQWRPSATKKPPKLYSNVSVSFFFFCCAGSLLLCEGFLELWWAGATLQLRCVGFPLCRAWALWPVGSVVVAPRL